MKNYKNIKNLFDQFSRVSTKQHPSFGSEPRTTTTTKHTEKSSNNTIHEKKNSKIQRIKFRPFLYIPIQMYNICVEHIDVRRRK